MSEHRDDAGGLDLETLAAALYRNIYTVSNTARGVEVSKGRLGKVRLRITGAALASKVRANTHRVAEAIVRAITECWSVDQTIQVIIEVTHAGFPPEAQAWRRIPTGQRWGQVRPSKIPGEVRRFKRALNPQLNRWDPVRLAAWTQWIWDEHIHPLGDGCGRTAQAIGAWVLTHRGLPLPSYDSRKAYHAAMAAGLRAFTEYYRRCFARGVGEQRPPKRAPAREPRHGPRVVDLRRLIRAAS